MTDNSLKKLIITLITILILAVIALLYFTNYFLGFLPSQLTASPTPSPIPTIYPSPKDNGQFCIQVITPAKNPQTGECREFPTPCDVPEGWEQVDSC